MDITVLNIKTFCCLFSAPDRHTVHKTKRAPCFPHGQALRWAKPPPEKRALCGLLNVSLMAVDFTNYRETGRHFLCLSDHYGDYSLVDGFLINLSAWQCYIANDTNIGYEEIGIWAFDELELADTIPDSYHECAYTFMEGN